MENNQVDIQKSKTKKIVLFGLGTLALGTLAFFGIKHFKNKTNENENDQKNLDVDTESNIQNPSNNSSHPRIHPAGNSSTFPLGVGSKGDSVRSLQQSLIRIYGAGILGKYGADGQFGKELELALRSHGYGVPLQQSDYLKITAEKKEEAQVPALTAFDPAAVAKGIYNSLITKDFNTAITLLKGIKNTTDYSLVSEQLKNYRIAGVRQTLVNATLNTFTESSQKLKVQETFKNMGLKYDGVKWTLSGLNGVGKAEQLITIKKCVIYKNGTQKSVGMNIPKDVVIGAKVGSYKGNTFFRLFDTNQQFHVANDCVEALKANESLSGVNSKIEEGDAVKSTHEVLAASYRGQLIIIPANLYLGKVKYLVGSYAEIDTGYPGEIRVNTIFLTKHTK